MNNYSRYSFFTVQVLFVGLVFTACDLVNPVEEVPAFIQVKDFRLDSDQLTQGSSGHQINDVWAFVNGEALGIFELPATIPILATGEQTIRLLTGIRENGLRSAPVIYPFYSQYESTILLEAGAVMTIEPTVEYISNSVFELVEDFEGVRLLLQGEDGAVLTQVQEVDKVREGTASGSLQLKEETSAEFSSTATFLDLPTTGGIPVFLEMDYRTNVELEVGLAGVTIGTTNPIRSVNYKVLLCPIEQWNKVYINFQEDLQLSQLEAYQLAFRVSSDDTGCGNVATEDIEILLDNIKLIRFQP